MKGQADGPTGRSSGMGEGTTGLSRARSRKRRTRCPRGLVALLSVFIMIGASIGLVGLVGVAGVVAAPSASAALGDPAEEAAWVLFAQLPDGAIATHPDRTFVSPYLAAIAATGLAAATAATGDATYAEAAWRFVEWHAAHMDENGYVWDHEIRGGEVVSTGDADSTDAYAAMFLIAIEAAHVASPDGTRLAARAPAMRQAVSAIRSTQRPDGLTGAKPTFMVAYLMDQAEVYAGLQAAVRLGRTLDDRALAREAAAAARRVRRGVARTWNTSTHSYDWAVHENGVRDVTNWSQLYPDALSQVWAVRYGLVRGPRARELLREFLRRHPNAHDPTSTDLSQDGAGPGGYWTGVGAVLARVDPGAPRRYLDGTILAAAGSGRAWPYSVQTAADVVHLATGRLATGQLATR